MTPRAVITGIGLVTPIGVGVDEFWQSLVSGRSGIGTITLFETDGWQVRIGGEVRGLDFGSYIHPERSRKMPRAAKLAVVAARLSLEDSGIEVTEENQDKIDIYLGVGCPGLDEVAHTVARRLKRGERFADPNAPAAAVTAAPAAHVAIELGIVGETITFSTSCSSATNAIGHALRRIRSGESKIVLAGGADAGVQEDLVASFACANALSRRNDAPEAASRPFEANRDGHVLSEAAGILVLEEFERAKARKARTYGEIRGYGTSNDSHSMAEVSKDETKASRCIQNALRDARLSKDKIDYYCAHGSSAQITDARETRMLKSAMGEHAYRLAVSSIKSMIGHPLGASGALQTATCALALQRGVVPPTINYEERDPECDLDYVPNESREKLVRAALNYSLGLGGNNAALVVSSC